VLYGVVLAAVRRHSAPGTLVQCRAVLRLHLARRVLALSDFPLLSLHSCAEFGDVSLGIESMIHKGSEIER
jgi:hypothetical protein